MLLDCRTGDNAAGGIVQRSLIPSAGLEAGVGVRIRVGILILILDRGQRTLVDGGKILRKFSLITLVLVHLGSDGLEEESEFLEFG